jgi:hypothetical protein
MPDEEVILDESTSDDERTIRVYDPRGDFLIKVPAGAKITFGYFNPAGNRGEGRQDWGRPDNVARQTALRIYEKGERSNQLACFIGVTGFRDHRIALTKLTQRVTIESNFEDDGQGMTQEGRKVQRALNAMREDEDVTF